MKLCKSYQHCRYIGRKGLWSLSVNGASGLAESWLEGVTLSAGHKLHLLILCLRPGGERWLHEGERRGESGDSQSLLQVQGPQ